MTIKQSQINLLFVCFTRYQFCLRAYLYLYILFSVTRERSERSEQSELDCTEVQMHCDTPLGVGASALLRAEPVSLSSR